VNTLAGTDDGSGHTRPGSQAGLRNGAVRGRHTASECCGRLASQQAVCDNESFSNAVIDSDFRVLMTGRYANSAPHNRLEEST
jgi:hypothetical protein